MRHIKNRGSFGNEGETGCWMRTGKGLGGNGVFFFLFSFSCNVYFYLLLPFSFSMSFLSRVSLVRVSTLHVFYSAFCSYGRGQAATGEWQWKREQDKKSGGRWKWVPFLRILCMARNGEKMDGRMEAVNPKGDVSTSSNGTSNGRSWGCWDYLPFENENSPIDHDIDNVPSPIIN